MRILLTCLLLFIPYQSLAQVNGPSDIELGKKIVLTVEDDFDLLFWSIPNELEYESIDNNKTLFLWGKVGAYQIQLNGVKLDWENKTVKEQKQYRHELNIVDDDKPPKPNPDPDLTGLQKDVFDWATQTVDKAYQSAASGLSDNYLSVATQLEGVELTIEQALEELRTLNNGVLDSQAKKDAWAVFGSRLQQAMVNAWPMNREEMVVFLKDVSIGLEYVNNG